MTVACASDTLRTRAASADGVHVTIDALLALQHLAARHPLPAYQQLLSQGAGQIVSRRPGRGIEFEEVRAYQPGDDVTQIDWRVTARSGQVHTRVFREERERPIYFVVDLTRPMFFGSQVAFKSVVAAQSAALLAWMALRSGDKVGAVFFTESGAHILPPKRGRRGVMALLRALVQHTQPCFEAQQADWPALSDAWQQRWPSGSQVVVLSDFAHFAAYKRSQLNLWHHKHALTLIAIDDPLERCLPSNQANGQYLLTDGGTPVALQIHRGTAECYAQQYAKHRQQLLTYARTRRIPLRFLCSSASVADLLSRSDV